MDRAGELFLAALNAAAFLFCASFIAYVVVIVVPFLRRQPAEPGDEQAYCWHFIVPCLDEQDVIAATVRRLMRSFPTAQLWCIDDASTDATPLVLARLARRYRRVHVVARSLPDARCGKGPALNAGWAALRASLPPSGDRSGVIVGVVDADGRLDPECLSMIAGPSFFGSAAVGAGQVKVRVTASHDEPASVAEPFGHRPSGLARLLVRLQDVEFACVIAAMQTLRRHVGTVGMGGNGQFTRLSVLDTIAGEQGTPWHGALLEDFELGLHVLLAGSRTEYCHDTCVTQEGLSSARQLVRQRSRWAQGSMQCFRYLLPILRSPRVTAAGAFEIAYFLFMPWLQLAGSLIYLVCGAVLVGYAVTFPGGLVAWLAAGGWAIIPLFVCFGLAPFAIWGPIYRATARRETSMTTALGLGLANWAYLAVHYLAIWWAFGRMVRTRHDWKKTARFAAASPGPRADDLAVVTLSCVLRFGPAAPTADPAPPFAPGRGPRVAPGRIRFPTASTPNVLTENR